MDISRAEPNSPATTIHNIYTLKFKTECAPTHAFTCSANELIEPNSFLAGTNGNPQPQILITQNIPFKSTTNIVLKVTAVTDDCAQMHPYPLVCWADKHLAVALRMPPSQTPEIYYLVDRDAFVANSEDTGEVIAAQAAVIDLDSLTIQQLASRHLGMARWRIFGTDADIDERYGSTPSSPSPEKQTVDSVAASINYIKSCFGDKTFGELNRVRLKIQAFQFEDKIGKALSMPIYSSVIENKCTHVESATSTADIETLLEAKNGSEHSDPFRILNISCRFAEARSTGLIYVLLSEAVSSSNVSVEFILKNDSTFDVSKQEKILWRAIAPVRPSYICGKVLKFFTPIFNYTSGGDTTANNINSANSANSTNNGKGINWTPDVTKVFIRITKTRTPCSGMGSAPAHNAKDFDETDFYYVINSHFADVCRLTTTKVPTLKLGAKPMMSEHDVLVAAALTDELTAKKSATVKPPYVCKEKTIADQIEEVKRGILAATAKQQTREDFAVKNLFTLAETRDLTDAVYAYKGFLAEHNLCGDTVLHVCVKHNNLDILECLLDVIEDTPVYSETINKGNAEGNSILSVAAYKKNAALVKFLLERNAKLASLNKMHETCFHIACKLGDAESLKHMLEFLPKQPDPNNTNLINYLDNAKMPALGYAIKDSNYEIVCLMLASSRIRITTYGGEESVLHMAASVGCPKIMRALIAHKDYDLHYRNTRKYTATHVAALHKSYLCALLLAMADIMTSHVTAIKCCEQECPSCQALPPKERGQQIQAFHFAHNDRIMQCCLSKNITELRTTHLLAMMRYEMVQLAKRMHIAMTLNFLALISNFTFELDESGNISVKTKTGALVDSKYIDLILAQAAHNNSANIDNSNTSCLVNNIKQEPMEEAQTTSFETSFPTCIKQEPMEIDPPTGHVDTPLASSTAASWLIKEELVSGVSSKGEDLPDQAVMLELIHTIESWKLGDIIRS